MVLTKLKELRPGIQQYSLNLGQLYPDSVTRARFEERWREFVTLTEDHDELFKRDGNVLIYQTESFLPPSSGGRTPVLLVLGNPASQSVRAGMCFAFERGSQVEHRFWRALRMAGWLSFNDADAVNRDVDERNASRRTSLLGGDYESPFLIGIDVFFSFPSPASAPKWAGVAGLARLFGRPAFRTIAKAEYLRLATTIAAYAPDGGAVIAFQRDAYEYLRDPAATPYSSAAASTGGLSSRLTAGQPIPLFAAPPTRYAHTQAFRSVLNGYGKQISGAQPRSGQ